MTTAPAALPQVEYTNSSWWIAKSPTSHTCHRRGAVTNDPPAIQRYRRELDPGEHYGRRFGDWTAKGWRVWRACTAFAHECDGQSCQPITATDAQITVWTRRIGPWKPLNGSVAAGSRSLPVLEAPPGWMQSASGESIYRKTGDLHVSAYQKRGRGGQWFLKIEMAIDVDDEYEAAALAEAMVLALGVVS